MRTCIVNDNDNPIFIAFTTRILQSYCNNLTSRDRALFLPHNHYSNYSPDDHAAALALLRTYSVRDVLRADYDMLAASILPPTYRTGGHVRGAQRESAAAVNAVSMSNEDAMAVQVYAEYRRARTELSTCLESIVNLILEQFQGNQAQKRALTARLQAKNAVHVQREILQVDMDNMAQRYYGVERMGYDERGDRVVFLRKVNGRWEEM